MAVWGAGSANGGDAGGAGPHGSSDPLGSSFEDALGAARPHSVAPPIVLAASAAVAGVASIVSGAVLHGSAAWLGWALGFLGMVLGMGYRLLLRSRETAAAFRADYRIDRLNVAAVAMSGAGVVLNAWVIAHQVVA